MKIGEKVQLRVYGGAVVESVVVPVFGDVLLVCREEESRKP